MALGNLVSFSFASGGGTSEYVELRGPFMLEITSCPSGATVTVQHSTDDGTTYTSAAGDAAGSSASYDVARVFILDVPVSGVRTRVAVTGTYSGNCTGKIGY